MATLKPPVSGTDHALGNLQAAVTLVEFGDFECPHCRHAHPLVNQLVKQMGKKMRFAFRHFPLQEMHPHAHMAALAAEAAARQDKFWEMHDLIYDNQNRLNGHFLLDLAGELGLDLARFGADWKSEEAVAKVEADFESGIRSGVSGTPSFFLNGRLLTGYDGSYPSLAEAVRLELETTEN